MSEEEIGKRMAYKDRLRHPSKTNHAFGCETEETLPTKNPELTIRLSESTVNELRAFSWELSKGRNNNNQQTYDSLILHLIDKCRRRNGG